MVPRRKTFLFCWLTMTLFSPGSCSKAPATVISFQSLPLDNFDADNFSSRGVMLSSLKEQLEAHRDATQGNILEVLDSNNVTYSSTWINNKIYVEGQMPSDLMSAISSGSEFPEITGVRKEQIFKIEDDMQIASSTSTNNHPGLQWGVQKIEADGAWGLDGGNSGEGVVVALLDTGVRATHESLRDAYRSTYGWFDAVEGSLTPIDPYNHGTGSAGVVAGKGGIGVAPNAKWIACRLYDEEGDMLESWAVKCGEWSLCPTRPDGSNPDCSQAPHVTSNSWGGWGGQSYFEEVLDAWDAANIVGIFSAGNEGKDRTCRSTRSPADYEKAIAVGATTPNDQASEFTSMGPSQFQGRIKPDVSAPGQEYQSASAFGDEEYMGYGGTSGACPHVSGVAALLKSRIPNLTNNQIRDLLQNYAERGGMGVDRRRECGGTPSDKFPNNLYGYGRVNAKKSLQAVINGRVD